jgi:hypothetical protein
LKCDHCKIEDLETTVDLAENVRIGVGGRPTVSQRRVGPAAYNRRCCTRNGGWLASRLGNDIENDAVRSPDYFKAYLEHQRAKRVPEGYKEVAKLEPRHEQVEGVVDSLEMKEEQSDDIVIATVEAVEARDATQVRQAGSF